jgi:hypothetical protein
MWSLLIQDLGKDDQFIHVEVEATCTVEDVKVMTSL